MDNEVGVVDKEFDDDDNLEEFDEAEEAYQVNENDKSDAVTGAPLKGCPPAVRVFACSSDSHVLRVSWRGGLRIGRVPETKSPTEGIAP